MRSVAFVLCAVVALAVSGCTSSVQVPVPTSSKAIGMLTSSGMVKEYENTIKNFQFPLPRGVTFPTSPPKSLSQGIGQPGVGTAPVYFFWLCAWEGEYLDAFKRNDKPRIDKALAELSTWESTPFVKQYVQDPGHGWSAHVLQPALLGDPTGVRQDVRPCPALAVPIR